MKGIVTLLIICLYSLSVFGQAKSNSNTTKQGALQESAKSKSATKIYERSGKNFTVSSIDRINTKFNEYYMTSYKDGIVFSTIKGLGSPASASDVSFFFVKPSEGNPVKFDINYTGSYIPIAVSFDQTEQQIFLTCLELSNAPGNKTGADRFHIFNGTMANGKPSNWNEPGFSKSMESAGFPVVNKSNNMLYFCGKQKGNNTGFDIYSANKSGSSWSGQKVLGNSVNTTADEIMPGTFNNTLFFSSNGRGGIGEFDICLIDLSKSGAESFILDAPMNTSGNDLQILVSKDNRSGYLINDSKRKQSGDIYSFKLSGSDPFVK